MKNMNQLTFARWPGDCGCRRAGAGQGWSAWCRWCCSSPPPAARPSPAPGPFPAQLLLGSWCRMEEGDLPAARRWSCSPLPAVECPPQSKYYSAIYAAMISADLQMSKQSHSHRQYMISWGIEVRMKSFQAIMNSFQMK